MTKKSYIWQGKQHDTLLKKVVFPIKEKRLRMRDPSGKLKWEYYRQEVIYVNQVHKIFEDQELDQTEIQNLHLL